ncbi:MAG: MSCRAMM family adhesin SdrC, partial [Akkermansiaceae bacterium]|nr:MSCRAMM family adhesin SdrC [Akkermansiaceae bacterium]
GGNSDSLVWIDANGDGLYQPTEPGLPGVTIYRDLNGNGRFDPDEPSAVTLADEPKTPDNEAGTFATPAPVVTDGMVAALRVAPITGYTATKFKQCTVSGSDGTPRGVLRAATGDETADGLAFSVEPDLDDDTIPDRLEQLLGTKASLADSDSDGLSDPDEFAIGSNPLVADTDDDGLNDAEEAALGTDPVLPDSDGDGLSDGNEVSRGLNPLDPDSDGDGLSDGEETTHHSNPLDPDTDHDGLSDYAEQLLGTNPLLADSDRDGVSDGDEVFAGTDPRDATDSATTPAALFERIGKVVNARVTATGFQLTRRNGPNPRLLRVQSSTTLGAWDTLMDVMPTGPSTTLTLPMGAPAKFYRFVENPPLP